MNDKKGWDNISSRKMKREIEAIPAERKIKARRRQSGKMDAATTEGKERLNRERKDE